MSVGETWCKIYLNRPVPLEHKKKKNGRFRTIEEEEEEEEIEEDIGKQR